MEQSMQQKTPLWKLIFGRIFAIWGLVVFLITMFPAFIFYTPCFFLKDPAKAAWHRHVSRVWMWIYLHLIGCPLSTKGKAYFESDENYVIVCNHNSLMDIPVSTPFMPRPNKTIAKKSFARIPIFGSIYTFGSVLVDRKSDESRRKSYDEMKRMLTLGLDMLIYPEGTRNRTGQPLKTFYDGAFRLAVDAGKPILPVVLLNTTKVLPASIPFYLMPHRLEMHFLPPVSTINRDVTELKEDIFSIMWNHYAQHMGMEQYPH